jgi:hypothetical protein
VFNVVGFCANVIHDCLVFTLRGVKVVDKDWRCCESKNEGVTLKTLSVL